MRVTQGSSRQIFFLPLPELNLKTLLPRRFFLSLASISAILLRPVVDVGVGLQQRYGLEYFSVFFSFYVCTHVRYMLILAKFTGNYIRECS